MLVPIVWLQIGTDTQKKNTCEVSAFQHDGLLDLDQMPGCKNFLSNNDPSREDEVKLVHMELVGLAWNEQILARKFQLKVPFAVRAKYWLL